MRVAVLGSGPAGLTAAHAVYQAASYDPQVHIFSRKQESQLYGAQYLHAPLPGLPGRVPSQAVSYVLQGDAEAYKRKVYGDAFMPQRTSVEVLPALAMGWDIRATYRQLVERYWVQVTDADLDPGGLHHLFQVAGGMYDLVVNTIPLKHLCKEGHQFTSQKVWAKGSTTPMADVGQGVVICNGNDNPAWYRSSNIFGYSTMEWPEHSKPPIPGVAPVWKPLRHNCTCWPWEQTKMYNVGRYGAWRKGYLVHHVYDNVATVVREIAQHGFALGNPNDRHPWGAEEQS